MRDHAAKDVHAEVEHPAAAIEEPKQEATTHFVAGQAPPVKDAAAGGAQQGQEHHTASQLAFEEDGHTKELKTKVGHLVSSKFGGDYKAAFEHYDGDKDGKVNKDEIVQLLSDAGVGNGLTRGAWANGIIDKIDSDGDKAISWAEFEKVFGASA